MKKSLLAIMVSGVLLAGCAEESSSPETMVAAVEAAVPVTVVDSRHELVDIDVEYAGIVDPVRDIAVQARVTGNLLDKHFKPGQLVKKGDLLYTLDPLDYEIELASLSAEQIRANAVLTAADRSYKRAKKLGGSISQQERDDLQAEYLVAKGELAALDKRVEQAVLTLSRTKIQANIDGRIGKSKFEEGDTINAGDQLNNLVDDRQLKFVVSLDEKLVVTAIRDFRKGTADYRVWLKFANGETYAKEGVLDFVDNEIDPNTGTLKVGFLFENDDSVFSGQYAKLVMRRSQEAIMVPQGAVMKDREGSYVFVIENDTAKRLYVSTAESLGADVIISTGLPKGSVVVSKGQQKIADGVKVSTRR